MKKTLKNYLDSLSVVAFILLFMSLVISIVGHLGEYGHVEIKSFFYDYYTNLGAELFSIAITVLVIDRLAFQRQNKRDELQAKANLIARASSEVREIAVSAIGELSQQGWLFDGTLIEANLQGANLQGAILHSPVQGGAKLRDAYLRKSNLSNMRLYEIDLEQAELQRAIVSGAQLVNANLKGANLDYADFQNTYLFLTDLEGAHFFQTNISNAILWNVNLLGAKNLTDAQLASASRMRDATMPNGRRYDGRFNLSGDMSDATKAGVELNNEKNMAFWYGVSLSAYQQGQLWAKKHPSELKKQ